MPDPTHPPTAVHTQGGSTRSGAEAQSGSAGAEFSPTFKWE